MTEQSKPQPAPATREEIAVALCKAAFGANCTCVGATESDCAEFQMSDLVRSWLAAERARALEESAQVCIAAANRYRRAATQEKDEDTRCDLLSNAIATLDLVPLIRALASEQKDAAR